MNKVLMCGCIIACSGALASAQHVSLTYDDLSGNYDTATGVFSAHAVDLPGLSTSGDVSRLAGSPGLLGNADFQQGFASLPGPADFILNLQTLPGDSSPTFGSFTATDHDGDTITGELQGFWTGLGAHFLAFNGTVSNASSDLSVNQRFDGDTSGWSGTNMPNIERGALVQLVFVAPDFFQTDFSDRTTGVTIQLIPTPASAALALMGLGVATRRRR